MCLVKEDKDLGYGICLNSCECDVIEGIKNTYKVYAGCQVKLFEFNQNTSVGLTFLNGRYKLDLAKSLCVDCIGPKLFKYLNAISDFKERIEFYRNDERREFVLHLKKDSVVSVGFSKGIQIKALFIGLIENAENIFITVKLLENPSSLILKDLQDVSNNKQSAESCIYSLPANLIRTFPPPAIIDQKNHENLQNDNTPSEHLSSVLHGSVKHEHRDNYIKSNVSIYKTISVVVEPPKTKINSQNPTGSSRRENYDEPNKNKMFDTSYNKATSDEPKNDYSAVPVRQHTKYFEKHSEKSVAPALNVSLNSSADIPKNSEISVAGSNVSKSDIGINCDDNKKNIGVQKNSKASVDSNISTDTSYNKATSDEPKNDYSAVPERQHNKYFEKFSLINNCLTNDQYIESVGSVQGPTRKNEYSTSNVNTGKSVSKDVEPVKKKIISQNPADSGVQENYHEPRRNETIGRSLNKAWNDKPKNDFTGETVGRNAKLDEYPCETGSVSALMVPSSASTSMSVINSLLCIVCLITVSEYDICRSCTSKMKMIYGQNISKTKIVSNMLLDSSLSSESPLTPLEINTHVTNEDDVPDNSNIAVRRNISASNCIICKNHLDISEGFVLILCKHIFCEMCIKNQITLKIIDHTNVLSCCDRPIELNEIKYFLYNQEYQQFKASSKQQCFDKNCTGYYLWEECGEKERPIKFKCNKCDFDNCLKCGTIHFNLTCGQYDTIRNSVDKETVELFLTWIREGIVMPCPKCEALIEKDEGFDWVQCSICNTEICWATRGPRWGPDGKGDTSGGCGCDFKVKKCVENCNYCH